MCYTNATRSLLYKDGSYLTDDGIMVTDITAVEVSRNFIYYMFDVKDNKVVLREGVFGITFEKPIHELLDEGFTVKLINGHIG